MRFVERKTSEQQTKAGIFRGRERLVHQRTELVNALRGILYECGHVFPTGLAHLQRIESLLKDPACDLPTPIITECRDLVSQIAEKTDRIDARTSALKVLAAGTDRVRRLQAMPGVGHLTAVAIEAFLLIWHCLRAAGTCGLAGFGAKATFVGRQGKARPDIKSWPDRHPAPFDHWGNVADSGTLVPQDPGRKLARADVDKEAAHIGGYCNGEQKDPAILGHADQTSRLSSSGAD